MAGEGPKFITIAPAEEGSDAVPLGERALSTLEPGTVFEVAPDPPPEPEQTVTEQIDEMDLGLSDIAISGLGIAAIVIFVIWLKVSQSEATRDAFKLKRSTGTVRANMRRARHDAIDFRGMRRERMSSESSPQ